MNASEYQLLSSRTGSYPTKVTLSPENATLMRGVIGLLGEAGEVAEIVKKHIYHGKDLDIGHFKEELGDVMWYMADICTAMDLDLDEILEMNVEKLLERRPNNEGDLVHITGGDKVSVEGLKTAQDAIEIDDTESTEEFKVGIKKYTRDELLKELEDRGYLGIDEGISLQEAAEEQDIFYDKHQGIWYEY